MRRIRASAERTRQAPAGVRTPARLTVLQDCEKRALRWDSAPFFFSGSPPQTQGD